MSDLPGRKAILDALRDCLNARLDGQPGTRKKDGTLTRKGNQLALEFLCGAAQTVHALGLDDSHGLTNVAWLAAVRGASDFLEG